MVDVETSRVPLDPDDVAAGLSAAGCPWPAPRILARTGSTNDDVAALAATGAPEGTSVAAEEQVHGRGRLDRTWLSPPGAGLAVSILVRAGDQPVGRWGLLSIAAGLAVRDALADAGDVTVDLKWPNDIVVVAAACGANVGYRKLGGILSQADASGAVVVGIGLNISLRGAELPVPEATSVFLEGGRLDRTQILVAILDRFAVRLAQWRADDARLLADYRRACRTIGRLVDVTLPDGSGVSGVATGIDDDGHLLVTDGEATTRVTAGDVVHASL